jgi:hypothetical protein
METQLQWLVKFIQNQGLDFICSKSTSVNMINTSRVPIKTAGGLLKFLISVSIDA